VEPPGGKPDVELTLPATTSEDTSRISHLLITTKAYDATAAIASIAHRLDDNSHVVLLVNGMGLLEELAKQYPHWNFYAGTTTEGAFRKSPRHIVHAGTGLTKFGQSGRVDPPQWFSDFSQLPIRIVWEPKIDAAAWQKLAVNCAINPLTAIHCCLNGELEKQSLLAAELKLLCEEIAAVALAANQGELAADLHWQVNRVVKDTAANRSSMLQDIQAGRQTEIEYITGYLVRTAQELLVPTPLNRDLLQKIRTMTARKPTDRDPE